MFKVIVIEGKQIPMKSSGRTGRLYAKYFQKDLLSDFIGLKNLVDGQGADTSIIENLAWTLAKNADEKIPDIDEWLEQFDSSFAIINKVKDIVALLDTSFATSVNPKKKHHHKKK